VRVLCVCCACVVCVVFITPLIFISLQEVSGHGGRVPDKNPLLVSSMLTLLLLLVWTLPLILDLIKHAFCVLSSSFVGH